MNNSEPLVQPATMEMTNRQMELKDLLIDAQDSIQLFALGRLSTVSLMADLEFFCALVYIHTVGAECWDWPGEGLRNQLALPIWIYPEFRNGTLLADNWNWGFDVI